MRTAPRTAPRSGTASTRPMAGKRSATAAATAPMSGSQGRSSRIVAVNCTMHSPSRPRARPPGMARHPAPVKRDASVTPVGDSQGLASHPGPCPCACPSPTRSAARMRAPLRVESGSFRQESYRAVGRGQGTIGPRSRRSKRRRCRRRLRSRPAVRTARRHTPPSPSWPLVRRVGVGGLAPPRSAVQNGPTGTRAQRQQ